MTDTPPMSRIIALRSLDVDGVRIDGGAQAEIRTELVPALLDCGAVDLWIDADLGAEGRAVADPGGSVPQAPGAAVAAAPTATVDAGDDTLPGAAPGSGDAATDAAPVSDTLPGGATSDSAGASPVDAAEGGVAPEALGEPAPPPAEAEEVPGGATDAPAAAAPVKRKGKRA
jgi:hypothetical protein